MTKFIFSTFLTLIVLLAPLSNIYASDSLNTPFHHTRYAYPFPSDPFFKQWTYDPYSVVLCTADKTIFLIAKERPEMFSCWDGDRDYEVIYAININPEKYLVIKAPLYHRDGPNDIWHREESTKWSAPIDAQKQFHWLVVINEAVDELRYCSDIKSRTINFIPDPADFEINHLNGE
ncbi:hypothetical protein [Selenomonas ruminantium]|uniref:hypothetical protein n=1 Tax=Selenomonas ruminantium TaxID=971 RepID=UPI0005A527C2|nr:hypothetical protein [Selenomonas ruminantium]